MKMEYKCECGKDILIDLDYESYYCEHCEEEIDVTSVITQEENKTRIKLKRELNALISKAIAVALIHNDYDFTSNEVQELQDYQDYLESDEV